MSTLNSWKIIEPDSYYKSFIENQRRPDGREWMDARELALKVGSVTTADGSATVRLGNTSVVCGIKAELGIPDLRKPNEGFIVPNVALHPCCSPIFKAGPPGVKAMVASQFLSDVLINGNILKLNSLCLVPNKICWCLFCDVVCLDYDGNLLDASLLALITALGNVQLPEVYWNEETEKVDVSSEQTKPLSILGRAVSTTFTLYNSDIHLLDPTYEDESEGQGEVTLVLDNELKLCSIRKSGGQVISSETLNKFLEAAKIRTQHFCKTIEYETKHR